MIRVLIYSLLTVLGPPVEHTEPDARMTALFEELVAAPNESEARFVAEEIEAIWSASGDFSSDLLMQRASTAAEQGEFVLARRLMDGALELNPEFAEAWARSASIAVASDDLARAVEDLNHALTLEPRHYEALVGLGVILERLGQNEGAFEAYTRALELYPLHPRAGDLAAEIERDARGRDL